VLHGIVGNNAAVPVFHCLGWAPLALHTVWYSHHKGHQGWFGEITPLTLFERFLQYALQAPHLNVTTVLSGYLGSAAQAALLARYLPEGRRYVCDPVIGDVASGQYVSDDIVQAYRELLVPRATVLLPNQFELGILAGGPVSTPAAGIDAARVLLAQYPALHLVVVKGIPVAGALHLLAVSRQHCTQAQHPAVDYRVSGTGDAFSAAWLALYLYTGDVQSSLTYAGQLIYRAVQRTAQEQQRELQLLAELPWLRQTAQWLVQKAGQNPVSPSSCQAPGPRPME
jgi:pyridoxine kinase